MNHAQVDYLLQLPVPRPEPAPLASRARDDAPPFDDHFRHASEASTAATSPPAAPTQSSSADRDDDRQPSTNSAPPAKSATSADDAAETDERRDEERDADEAELAETAEAAALLAAAEQVTQAIGSEAAVDAENTVPVFDHPDGVSSQPAAEAHGEPISAADATQAASEAGVGAKVAAAQLGQPDTAEPDLAAATVENSSVESLESQPASAQKDGDSPRVNAKSHSGEHGSNDNAVDGDASERQSVAQAAAAVLSGDPTPATKTENRSSAVEGTAKKSDKKSTTRADAALRDAATPPNERTAAAVARAADASAIAPTAANVQAQLQSGGTAPSASVDSTTKPKDAIAGVKEGLLSPFARLDRNHASGSRRAGRGEGAPHVDPARFVSRVARAIQTAEERGGPLQLRLSPPELGAMRLEISVNQGALTATIETENSNARQLLLDNLPALRDRLAEQNVKIERFDVDVRRDTSGNGQPNFGPQEHGQHERHNPLSDRHGTARRAAVPQVAEETSPIRRAITNTSINVVA